MKNILFKDISSVQSIQQTWWSEKYKKKYNNSFFIIQEQSKVCLKQRTRANQV